MTNTDIDIEFAVLAAVLSTSARHLVLFRQRLTLSFEAARAVLPVARTRGVTVRVRVTVRAPTGAGTYDLVEQAVAGFAGSVAGWVRKFATKPASGLERALRKRLCDGPIFAAALVTERGVARVPSDCADRASRWFGADQHTGSVSTRQIWAGPSTAADAGIDRRVA